ncbi:MAG: hypothetical protein IT257_01350 [Chitinophagaceae bacterium]|nr:hypothetical protein [Chitinophagaceae bacterium]
MSDYSSIFVNSHCVSKAQLLSYIRQTLDREEAYVVECHISDCQFCNDALDALMEADLETAEKHLQETKGVIHEHLFPPPEIIHKELKSNGTVDQPDNTKNLYRRLLAAASILLLIGLGGFSVFSYIQSHKKELALVQNEKGVAPYDAKYSKPDQENGEIVHLNVEDNDSFRKYAEPARTTQSTDNFSANSKSVTEESKASADEKALTKTQQDEVVAKPAVPVMKEKVADFADAPAATENANFEPAPGMENFARADKNERQKVEAEKTVAKKKSAAGMKYDNNMQSNQMNYPRAGSNDNLQRNAEPVVAQKEAVDDIDKELSPYEKGLENFNQKNYRKSISYFQKALKNASGNEREDIMYYLALAYENTGKTNKANELYTSLSGSKKYGKRAEKKLNESQAEDARKK